MDLKAKKKKLDNRYNKNIENLTNSCILSFSGPQSPRN